MTNRATSSGWVSRQQRSPLRAGANTLNFSAKYYSPLGNATAGDASAVATYTVTYS